MASSVTHVEPHQCPSEGQDQLHGPNRRVWNCTKKGHRCTACGVEEWSSKWATDPTVKPKRRE